MTQGRATLRANVARWRPPWDSANAKLAPLYVVEGVRAAFGGSIGLDPCTEPDNPTSAEIYWTIADNGLGREWQQIASSSILRMAMG